MALEDQTSVREGILTEIYPRQLVSDGNGLISPDQVYVTLIAIQTPVSLIVPAIVELIPESGMEANAQSLSNILLRGSIGKKVFLETTRMHVEEKIEYVERALYVTRRQRGLERPYNRDRCVVKASVFKLKNGYLSLDSLLRM